MAIITCPKCGTEYPDDRMNCQKCGINLQWALENLTEVEHREGDEPRAMAVQTEADTKRPRTLQVIFGIVLLFPACVCFFAGITFPTDEIPIGSAAMIATIIAGLLAGAIPLVLGPSKTSVMYFINALFLAVMSLIVHPWSLGGSYGGLGAQPGRLYLVRRVLTLADLFVVLPCLGAVLFGTLCARKTQLKGLRIISWILVGIGGLGAILFLVELAKIFAPPILLRLGLPSRLDEPGYVAMGGAIIAGLLAGAIPLLLGRSKTSIMYFVNVAFLAVMTLRVHAQVLDIYAMMSRARLRVDIRWLTLPNLFVVLPSLGAVAFGILCARKTQLKALRIISWICVGIGGLGTILFVVFAAGLAKFFI